MMMLPDFLIIGAMKAGTTTLWADLRRHPDIFMPATKEPETLRFPDTVSRRGKRRYAALFRKAPPGRLCGEASTLYSKLPESREIAARARVLLGEELRLIYVVRDPIERAVSHHKHLWRRRQAPAAFDQAVQAHPEIIDYGCYARQIEPWLGQFSRKRLLVLRFEELVRNRQATLTQVVEFLGLPPVTPDLDEQTAFNSGDVNAVLHIPGVNDWFYQLRMTPAYQWLSEYSSVRRLKRPVKALFQRPLPSEAPHAPSPAMLAELRTLYEVDMRLLADYLGWETPVWDLSGKP